MRGIPRHEFDYIVNQGFWWELPTWEIADLAMDPAPDSVERPIVEQVVRRPFRDEAFILGAATKLPVFADLE
jgi:hypothetical protein